jgi:glycine/D-amino acid oxidase-like deaminating enzyme
MDLEKENMEAVDRERIGEILDINIDSSMKGDSSFPDVHAGIHGHSCGALSGMALAEHYVKEFESLGGKFLPGTGVESFELTGGGSRYAPWDRVRVKGVTDACGDVHLAGEFVVCAGAWTHDLLAPVGIASGVLPKKRQLFGLKLEDVSGFTGGNSPDRIPATILPAGGVYIKPVLKNDMLIVGCADDLGQPFVIPDGGKGPATPDPDYFRKAIEPVLRHYFPNLGDYELKLKWAGYYSYHWPDMNPVIESVKNLTWVSGTSGSGIMKADAIGRIAAARLQGLEYAELADGTGFRVSKLSLRQREVEAESFVI